MIMNKKTGAQLLIETLINFEVEHVFTVPGAKIDKILDTFNDYPTAPKLVVMRHEQNATFVAQAIGRLAEKPGVVLATSGPGVSNLATGLVTATSENDPVLAIGGSVNRKDALKRTHQSMNNVALMEPVTKYSAEIISADAISEAISNAMRIATQPRMGASFLSIPNDVQSDLTTNIALSPVVHDSFGHADTKKIVNLAQEIASAKFPVVLLGMRAPGYAETKAIREFLTKINLPVVQTFQAAGIINRELENLLFYGRVGLFKNQPGDELLDNADLVITVGFDPIEYDTEIWNKDHDKRIFHIDETIAEIDNYYRPHTELVGDIHRTIRKLMEVCSPRVIDIESESVLKGIKEKLNKQRDTYQEDSNLVHPLHFIQVLRNLLDDPEFSVVDDQTVMSVDIGSIYIWMARNMKVYEPKKLLFTNGMQTLGVALPWAMGASFLHPGKKMISMSGDGGFLFSSQEIDTAIRENLNITHFVWDDCSYNMVKFQEEIKYGRATAVELGPIDFAAYAESFGAKGFKVEKPSDLETVMREALSYQGVAVVWIPIDYRENIELGKKLLDKIN